MSTYTSECYIKNCRILLHYSKINLFRSKPFSKYFHCINTREKDSPELSLLIRIRIIIIITHSLSIGDHCRVCFSVYFLYVSLFYYCHFPFFFSFCYSYLWEIVCNQFVLHPNVVCSSVTKNISIYLPAVLSAVMICVNLPTSCPFSCHDLCKSAYQLS